MTAQPDPLQGRLFRHRDVVGDPVPVVVDVPMVAFDVMGEPGRTFYLDVNGAPMRQPLATSATGAASVEIQLQAGANRVCAVIDEISSIEVGEAAQCITVAYVP